MCRSSKLNADVYLRRLRLFCEQRYTTPKKLVSIGTANPKQVEDMLHDHVQQLETEGYAPSYIKGVLKAVRSWLSYNYVELKRKIKVANADMAVTLQDERVPTREELKAILNHASIRARASAGLIAFAGLRPQVLGNASASDGPDCWRHTRPEDSRRWQRQQEGSLSDSAGNGCCTSVT